MKKLFKSIKILPLIIILIFSMLLIINPDICKKNVAQAIIICSQVLIPSLFPFGVCMLFILKSEATKHINPVLLIFLFSLLGGYPMGAKLINEAVKSNTLSRKSARKMLNCCVNGGPAFIVSAVGVGLLKSKKIGLLLLITHVLSSFIVFILSGNITENKAKHNKYISPVDNFIISTSDSAAAVISICFFVILFSVFTGYIEAYSSQFLILKPLVYLTEITLAVTKTRSVIFISFLLGFSGFCIWTQVLSVGKDIKINIIEFAFFRLLHGSLSGLFTYLALKIFSFELPVYSNGINFTSKPFSSTVALGISLIVLGAVFIISVSNKREDRKILEEFV